MGRKMKSFECLNRFLCHLLLHCCKWLCSFIYWEYYLPNIFFINKMIEKISSKNSEYLLQSVNSSYKYYIFCCCWLPLQCFQFLLHSQLWEEYWWPIPRYKPSFINSKMEQSMAFPWTAFLSIPLPPTASSKGCNVYVTVCECVSTFKGCPCVCAPFLVFAGTTRHNQATSVLTECLMILRSVTCCLRMSKLPGGDYKVAALGNP